MVSPDTSARRSGLTYRAGLTAYWYCEDIANHVLWATVSLESDLPPKYRGGQSSTDAVDPPIRVRDIEFLAQSSGLNGLTGVDWGAVDEYLSRLPRLIQVSFEFPPDADVASADSSVVNEMGSRFPNLSAQDKLSIIPSRCEGGKQG